MPCSKCGSNLIRDTFHAYECQTCHAVEYKFDTVANVLSNDEIYDLVISTVKKHKLTSVVEINALKQSIIDKNSPFRDQYKDVFEHPPVDIVELLESEKYMGDLFNTFWPGVKDEIKLILGSPHLKDIVFRGSLGWGKTFSIATIILSKVMQMCFLKSPQEFYNLNAETYIGMYNFCVTEKQAHRTLFIYLINFFDAIPWFRKNAPRVWDKTSEIDIIGKKIIMRCGPPNPQAMVGTNIHTWCGDELNFMQHVQDSKQARDGGEFDQALDTTEALRGRQKSRFTDIHLYAPPQCLLASSEMYPEDFLPKYVQNEQDLGHCVTKDQLLNNDYDSDVHTTYVAHYATWETRPKENFPGWTFECDLQGNPIEVNNKRTFKVFQIGLDHPTKGDRLLKENENTDGYGSIVEVPIFYLPDFDGGNSKLYGALRDVAGVATLYNNPWFNVQDLKKCINPNRMHPCNYLNPTLEERDFKLGIANMIRLGGGKKFINPHAPRFVHLDLSKNEDHTGIGIVHIAKFVPVIRKIEDETVVERLPFYFADLMLRIKPPLGGRDIDYSKIRNIIYLLQKYGMKFKLVTYDHVQGEMGQFLQKHGIETDHLSMDTNIQPWHVGSLALAEKRLDYYDYQPFMDEAPYLFHDIKKNKVDHRPNKRKDCSDSLFGAIFGAYQSGAPLTSLLGTIDNIPMIDNELTQISHRDAFAEYGMSNFYGNEYGCTLDED